MTIELEPDLEAALTRFAEEHSMTRERVLSNAIHEYLDAERDEDDAARILAAVAEGGRTYTSAEVRQELGLDD